MPLPPPDYYSHAKKFIYVEGHYQKPSGKASLWQRIRIDEIDQLRKKSNNYNVFCTVQQFESQISRDGELQYTPMYFDFDSNPAKGIPFSQAQKDARAVIDFFTIGYGIDKTELRVFFSGNKGFHIFIHPVVIGTEPHIESSYIYKQVALFLKAHLQLKSLDDKSIYSIKRQMRLNNSMHHTSGLFKIELDYSEVTMPESEIRALAKKPRTLYDDDEFLQLNPNERVKEFFEEYRRVYERQKNIERLKPQKIIQKSDTYPVCVKDLLDNSIRESGTRNLATMCLSCFFKDQGYPIKDTKAILLDWMKRIPKNMTTTKNESILKASTVSCLASVYSNKNYHFVCNVMRSLSKDIKCDWSLCKITNEHDQEPENAIILSLNEASYKEYIRKKIQVNALVAGKSATPYGVPSRIQYTCEPEIKIKTCQDCFLNKMGGHYELVLTSRHGVYLELIQCTKGAQYIALKKYLGLKDCKRVNIVEVDMENIEEVLLSPEVEKIQSSSNDNMDYIIRKAYYIGKDLSHNEEIQFTGYTHPDPKTQQLVHMFSQFQSSETSLSKFKLTPDLRKRFKIFQLEKGQTIQEKLDEIYYDLECNILHIWQRRPMLFAMDLAYHSVLHFYYYKDLVKGWLDIFILGDSGQAKSDMFLKLQNHYGLGVRVAGETAKRTGLGWTWIQANKQWSVRFGVIPSNDKRLLCIDETAGIDGDTLAALTDMRSTGVADARGGPVAAKASARTRLIWMSNTKEGKQLSNYTWGVTTIPKIFTHNEDVRRLDFAIAVASGDVPLDEIHRRYGSKSDVHHKYTSDACHNLVLFAWTRNAKQVNFTDEALSAISRATMRLGEVYSAVIPLVENSVQHKKIARIATALAARLYSVDEQTGETIIVKQEHVDYVVDYIDREYKKRRLDYADFSDNNPVEFTKNKFMRLKSRMVMFEDYKNITSLLISTRQVSETFIRAISKYDKDAAHDFLSWMLSEKICTSKGRYNTLTDAGATFLKQMCGKEPEPVIQSIDTIDDIISTDDLIDNAEVIREVESEDQRQDATGSVATGEIPEEE